MSGRCLIIAECGEFEGAYLDPGHDIERDQNIGCLCSLADSYAEAYRQVLEFCENPADLDGLIIWPVDESFPSDLIATLAATGRRNPPKPKP